MREKTKRKRRGQSTTKYASEETTASDAEKKKKLKRNPFRPPQTKTPSIASTLLLDSILRFTHRPKKKDIEVNGDANVKESKSLGVEEQQDDDTNRRADFDRILAYLHDGKSTSNDVAATISRYDVARMILTWSLQQVLRSQSSLKDILWALDAVLLLVKSPNTARAVGTTAASDNQEQGQEQLLRRLLEHSFTPRILGVLVDRIILTTTAPVEVIQRVYPQLLTFYHPTMEVACRQVLLRLHEIEVSPKQSALQHSTRAWIAQDVSRRGNPKTNFTLLATTPALLFALAEDEKENVTATSSNKVIWKLLFAWRYHGDGYDKLLLQNDSENNNKKQPPIQAQLLSTVTACLQDKHEFIPMLRLLPSLLEGFCHHTTRASASSTAPIGVTTKQRGGGANSKSAAKLDPTVAGTLQLRLFHLWAQAVLDMAKPNNTSSDTTDDAILHRVTCLAQLLQRICDTKSARQHPDLRTLPVLSDATAFLLSNISTDTDATPTMMAAANTALCCLVRLHHGLLDDAGWVQALQALLNSINSNNNNNTIELFDLCIDTFTRLRQQGRCMEILVQVGRQRLPAFLAGDLWISMIETAPLAERTAILQVVRQHPWIAPYVLPYILIDSPVAAQAVWQVSAADDGSSSRDTATASFWDLQARCAFWLGCNLRMNEDDDVHTEDTVDALVRDCYRLRAWHGRMQEEEFHALAEDRPVDGHWRTRGVALVEGLTSSPDTRWTQLLPHLEFWLPLTSDVTVDRFLQWLLRSAVLEEEKSTSIALLQDATFYQHDCIANRLHRVGVSLIAVELLQGHQSATGKVPDGPMTEEQRINQLGDMAKRGAEIAHLPIAESFEKAIQYIKCLNALPLFLGDDQTDWEVIMWLFKVDGFAQSLLKASNVSSQIEHNVLTLMAGVRKFIGRHLPLFNSCCVGTSLPSFQSRLPDNFVPALIRTTVESLQTVCHDVDGLEAVATTTADIVRLILLSSWPQSKEEEAGSVTPDKSLTVAIKDLGGIYSKTKAKVDMKVGIAILIRAILDGLQCSQWSKRSGTWNDEARACAGEFVKALSPFTLPKANTKATDRPLVCNMVRYDVMVLQAWEADWLPIRGTTKSSSKLEGLLDLCISLLDDIMLDSGKSICQSWCYLAALLAETSPSWELAAAVSQASAALHKDQDSSESTALLSDACFCRMIEGFSDDELSKTIEKVLQQSNSRGTEPSVRLMRLTLQYTKVDSQTQREQPPTVGYTSMGMDILATALKYLVKDRDAHSISPWSRDVVEAAKLVGELIKRRDVHTFSEFELSVVLSRINEILRSSNESSSSTFSALAALYTLLFQRYTKPMYACVANVMTVLQAFLVDAMQDQDAALREKKAQHVIRMCEGLVGHRDVFKKHVVGLCVTFVSQGGTMEDVRHDPLLPAIFYLLDTMTKYEVDQLHAFLNETSKTSLKTIQNMYEKSHVFRGQ